MSGGRGYRIAVLHQGCVPVYRRAFFERLSERSQNTYVIFHGRPPSNTDLQAAEPPFSFENRKVDNREFRLGKSILVYQPAVRAVTNGDFDAVVLGHEFKFLSGLLILVLFKLRRRPVVWWGFGYRKAYGSWQKSGLGRLKDRLARWGSDRLARLGDGYLAYTGKGREHLLAIGFRDEEIQVVRNTIDVDEQIRLADAVADLPERGLRAEFGLQPESHVLLYVGRLVPRKRVDWLIRFARAHPRADGKPVEVLVIGDGQERAALERLADGAPNIHFLGAIDPADIRIAKAMKLAAAVVVPGYLGLAINHAFAHARPVITEKHDFHSPEIEFMTEGHDGLMFPGGEEGFQKGLLEFLADEEAQARLCANAARTRETLKVDAMVEAYDGFLTRLLDGREARR
ncbi:glycosyltransferase family 4 protein [Stappia sp. F7233]|uniref:Glycosyltransferase family 4 protein n=1 Tax=Stappia albiluteola TaxID=2758565 RepID=A0A839A8P0_9HYPH|nr:glycosyltransferase family 4 protein [Stappia albiluteola]MBA5775940.1 glycosyltransferase family 4 protein [Stappia albiluteola]